MRSSWREKGKLGTKTVKSQKNVPGFENVTPRFRQSLRANVVWF